MSATPASTVPSGRLARHARHALPGTSLLAWRNLAHDRARFIVTLVGIVFSVVLMGVQMGLLVGFARTASGLVDHTEGDLWVTAAGTTNVDIAATISQRWRMRALATPGVADAENLMAQFAFWRKPSGGNESVVMVGINPANPIGRPWRLVEGRLEDLAIDGAVILDTLYKDKLDVTHLGQIVEISNRRARVVGFTSGIRTFTQSPYVFTTHANAQAYSFTGPERTTYVIVRVAEGYEVDAVRAALQARMPDVTVWTREGFAWQTRIYWMTTTGAGAALSLAAMLGLVVGIVIVGQTLYASTVDRLPEYATLRAMGAPHGYLYRVIIKQALISAALGYAAGFAVILVMVLISSTGNIAIAMPPLLALTLAALTLLMCLAGAVFSIRRIMRIDPTSVFA